MKRKIRTSFFLLSIFFCMNNEAQQMLLDIKPGAGDGQARYLTEYNGLAYFRACDAGTNIELWVTDGTTAGTSLFKDINPGTSWSNPGHFYVFNGHMYFSAILPGYGAELMRTDGTNAGTILVSDIVPGSGSSYPNDLMEVNNILYFAVDNPNAQLWKTDGTNAGTVLVKDFPSATGYMSFLQEYNGELYFVVDDGTMGEEIWKSDGTTAGTTVLKDIVPGPTSSNPFSLVVYNNLLYFSAIDGVHGRELWKTDGTLVGTQLALDLSPGSYGSGASHLTVMGNTLYFASSNATFGSDIELWKTDGTIANTALVKDIWPGTNGSMISDMTAYNGVLYFRASDGMFNGGFGSELWTSDGTAAGTYRISDIDPGGDNSNPWDMVGFNGSILFNADDGVTGRELYIYNPPPVLTSIIRDNPSSQYTNADVLSFIASFDRDVIFVDAADFTVTGTTATISSVSPITANEFRITVSGGNLANLNGTVGIDLAAGQDITDMNNIALVNREPAIDETYSIDNTVPVLNSFTCQTPATQTTNADVLTFRATFDGDVQNVDATDYTAIGTTASISVTPVSASVYNITLTGGDLADLNTTVGLNLAIGQNISDAAGNALAATEPTIDQTFIVDNAAPVLTSFTRQTPTAQTTNADALKFRATFDGDVQNVDATDFTATGTTASISLTPVSPSVYDITLTGGDLADLNVTVELDIANGQNITDAVGNALATSEPAVDETYIVDNTAPTLLSITRQTPTGEYTNADALTFRVTFDEEMQNVDAADFLAPTTTANTTVTPVSASIYDVRLTGGDLADLNDRVGIILDAGQNITDIAGNPVPGTQPSTLETYLVDNTTPTINLIGRFDPLEQITNSDELLFVAGFSEPVQNVNASDFSITGTTAGITTVLSIAPDIYQISVSGGDLAQLNAVVGLDLSAGQNIIDLAGNPLTFAEPQTNETYILENTVPVLNSISRQAPAEQFTNADELVFRASFNKDVLNVDANDFSATGTSATISVTQVSADIYGIRLVGGDLADLNATVGLNLAAGQNITDAVGHTLANTAPTTDETYIVDNTVPILISFTRHTPAEQHTNADVLSFSIRFDEDVQSVDVADFSVSGTSAIKTLQTVSPKEYTLILSGGDLPDLNASVELNLDAGQDITDIAGNTLADSEPSIDEHYIVDNNAPVFISVDDDGGDNTYIPGDVIRFIVDLNETGLIVTGGLSVLDPSFGKSQQFTDNGDGTYSFTTPSINRNINIQTEEDYTIVFTAVDLAGNSSQDNSLIITLDMSCPQVRLVTSSNENGTYKTGAEIYIQIHFTEEIEVTGTPLLRLETGKDDAIAEYISGSGTNQLTFLYNVLKNHTCKDLCCISSSALSLNGGSIKDTEGNTASLSLPTPGANASLSYLKDLNINPPPPVLLNACARVNSKHLLLTFDKDMKKPEDVFEQFQVNIFNENITPIAGGGDGQIGSNTKGFNCDNYSNPPVGAYYLSSSNKKVIVLQLTHTISEKAKGGNVLYTESLGMEYQATDDATLAEFGEPFPITLIPMIPLSNWGIIFSFISILIAMIIKKWI